MVSGGTFILVTGASRGLGRAFSVELAKKHVTKYPSVPLRLCLIARDKCGLQETKLMINDEIMEVTKLSRSIQVTVGTYSIDLADISKLEERIEDLFLKEKSKTRGFINAILINNAGSVGEINNVSSIFHQSNLQAAVNLNITSCFWLTSQFMSSNIIPDSSKTIVNISSLAAVQSMKTMSIYCAGKAARDMYHLVLSEENDDVYVINYAPGPCDTNMQDEIRECPTTDQSFVEFSANSKINGTLVDPKDSAVKLANLVFCERSERVVKTGSHIDYFDL